MKKSVHDYAPISTTTTSYSSFSPKVQAENVELHAATPLNPHTTERLTGWKSLEPNHTKLITSNKMAAVTKIGVCSSLLGTEKKKCLAGAL